MAISAPFALMHSAQLGAAWGPLLLLYCVSLALCAARLLTRSLAASTLVHATYNFLLFAVTFVQTDGFRHLDKV
jgi:membrane protease YdiL (CAAX protease family)